MTKLTSLLIGSGDSFLLENDSKNYLIDSGGNQNLILKLIPEKINLAICTHNDSDHCKGFIGILKSDHHIIDEIWLPGIWATVIDFIRNEKFTTSFSRQEIDGINLTDINIESLLSDSNESIDEFTDDLGFLSDYPETYNPIYRHIFFNHHIINDKIRFNINRILEIARLAYEKGVAIKWFFPDNNGDSTINNFKPINSKHLLKMKKIRNDNFIYFLQLAYLTSENENSLVFEYQINDLPRILFTADSLVSIAKPYTNEIIITAPHHGSKSNSQVYANIKGSNLIWIRSDRPSFSRPCPEFLNLDNKYCLSCTKTHPIQRQEIIFEFINGKWNYLKGLNCTC